MVGRSGVSDWKESGLRREGQRDKCREKRERGREEREVRGPGRNVTREEGGTRRKVARERRNKE